MTEVKFILRTADQLRKVEVTVLRATTGTELIDEAVKNWNLPTDTDYSLVNTSTGRGILPTQNLSADTVEDGHIVELQPVLVAG